MFMFTDRANAEREGSTSYGEFNILHYCFPKSRLDIYVAVRSLSEVQRLSFRPINVTLVEI